MDIKLFDSEMRIMSLLWEHGALRAQQIAKLLAEQTGWSKTTTYTLLKRSIDKGLIERIEPDFICRPLVTREQVQQKETDELIDKLFGGAPDLLVSSLLSRKALSAEQIEKLRNLIDELK